MIEEQDDNPGVILVRAERNFRGPDGALCVRGRVYPLPPDHAEIVLASGAAVILAAEPGPPDIRRSGEGVGADAGTRHRGARADGGAARPCRGGAGSQGEVRGVIEEQDDNPGVILVRAERNFRGPDGALCVRGRVYPLPPDHAEIVLASGAAVILAADLEDGGDVCMQ